MADKVKLINTERGIYEIGGKTLQLDPATGEFTKVLNPNTGEFDDMFNPQTDKTTQGARAFVEGALPATRPIAALSSAISPQSETLQALNPYQGKNVPETAIAATADITGQAAQTLVPGGILSKYIVPGAMGLAMKTLSDEAMKNPELQKAMSSPEGQAVLNYVLPTADIALSTVGLAKGLKVPKTVSELNSSKIPETMGQKGTILGNEGLVKQPKMEALGFKASGGAKREAGDALRTSIQKGIKQEMNNFETVYNDIKNIPVPKETIKATIDDMKNASKELGNSREAMALKRDINKYIKILSSKKNPTVEQIDMVKRDWNADVRDLSQTFEKSFDSTVADRIGRNIKESIENAIPTEKANAYKKVKGSYGSMAEARTDLKSVSKISSEQIMQRINTGDKLDAIERLADPNDIVRAIKADVASAGKNDPIAVTKGFIEKINKIDEVNPELANQLVKLANLPIVASKGTKKWVLAGSLVGSAGSEGSMAVEYKKGGVK